MASRGRGRRERRRGTGQAQSVLDQRTFVEAVGITANAIARASIACRQEDPSNPPEVWGASSSDIHRGWRNDGGRSLVHAERESVRGYGDYLRRDRD